MIAKSFNLQTTSMHREIYSAVPPAISISTRICIRIPSGRWARSLSTYFRHFDSFLGRNVPLPPKPLLHGTLQPLHRHSVPGLEQAVRYRQGVIEDRVVREIAHGKVINPVNWARMPHPGRIDPLHSQFSGKHGIRLIRQQRGIVLFENGN